MKRKLLILACAMFLLAPLTSQPVEAINDCPSGEEICSETGDRPQEEDEPVEADCAWWMIWCW